MNYVTTKGVDYMLVLVLWCLSMCMYIRLFIRGRQQLFTSSHDLAEYWLAGVLCCSAGSSELCCSRHVFIRCVGHCGWVITTVGGPVVPCMITVGSQKRSISPSLKVRQLEEDVEKLLHHALVRDT